MEEGGAESPTTIEGNAQRDIQGVAASEIEKALSSKKGSKRPSLIAEKGSRRQSVDQDKGSRRASLDPGKLSRKSSLDQGKSSRRESLSLGKEKPHSTPKQDDKKQTSETVEDERASSEKIESNSPKSTKDPKSQSDEQDALADAGDALLKPISKDESVTEALEDTSAAEVENLETDLPQPDYTEGPNAQSKENIFAEPVEENVLDNVLAQLQGGDEGEKPILIEDAPTGLQAATTKSGSETKLKRKLCSRESCRIAPAEVMYKAAARVIQDPTKPLHRRPCAAYIPGTSVRGAQGGSNRQDTEAMRRELLKYRRACSTKWQLNPACTVPMRAKPYSHSSRMSTAAAPVEEWIIWEERDKDRRDHELAVELGYETLVGNLLYIDIPGGNDINRSWQNFLSEDAMEWGFPYEKGSIERPRMKWKEPYLAHQVKEKLWKFPRARTFQTAQED
ncbi:hypothetical protein BsWGS_13459 [Bradybaena similaris]